MADVITDIRALERGEIEILETEKRALLVFLRLQGKARPKEKDIAIAFVNGIEKTEKNLENLKEVYEKVIKDHKRGVSGGVLDIEIAGFCELWKKTSATGIIGEFFHQRGTTVGNSNLIIFLRQEQEKLMKYAETMSQEFFGESFGITHGVGLNETIGMFKKRHGWR